MDLILQNRQSALATIDPRHTAVLAVHWQNDVIEPTGAFGPIFGRRVAEQGLVARARRVFAAARQAGATIIYVNVAYTPGHLGVVANNALFRTSIERNAFVRGTRGAQVVQELAPEPGDLVVEHGRISAFYGNDLDTILAGRAVRTVVVTGMATNVAVDHTVRDAVQKGFNTLLLEDCCCSSDDAFHQAALLTLRALASEVLSSGDFIAALTAAPGPSSGC